jgi:hypothetical protein
MRKVMRIRRRRAVEPSQREVLREVMLSASECGTWLTLDELARLTHYPQTSISAQLRHLRKPAYGAFVVEKQRREAAEVMCVMHCAVWEYQLRRGMRAIPGNSAKPGRLHSGEELSAEPVRAVL